VRPAAAAGSGSDSSAFQPAGRPISLLDGHFRMPRAGGLPVPDRFIGADVRHHCDAGQEVSRGLGLVAPLIESDPGEVHGVECRQDQMH